MKYIRKKFGEYIAAHGLTQKEAANKMSLSQQSLGNFLSSESLVRPTKLKSLIKHYPDFLQFVLDESQKDDNYKYLLSYLKRYKVPMLKKEVKGTTAKIKPIQPSSNQTSQEATLLPTNYMRVPRVPVNAQAGVMSGFGDADFWESLPFELWEVDKEYKGRYVIFDVKGDSMNDNSIKAILEGDKLLCREVPQKHWSSKLHINSWNFIIVHRTEGVLVKRIVKHDTELNVISCHSLNPYYADFDLHLTNVLALYHVVDLKRKLRL